MPARNMLACTCPCCVRQQCGWQAPAKLWCYSLICCPLPAPLLQECDDDIATDKCNTNCKCPREQPICGSNGKCSQCALGLTACPSGCTNVDEDPLHCECPSDGLCAPFSLCSQPVGGMKCALTALHKAAQPRLLLPPWSCSPLLRRQLQHAVQPRLAVHQWRVQVLKQRSLSRWPHRGAPGVQRQHRGLPVH